MSSSLRLLCSTLVPSAKRAATVVAVALALAAVAAQAADPFYLRLLREGTDSYNRKDYVAAVRQLRIACFGFLDEPDRLADGLTRLALAQAAAGDTAGFSKTFERIVEVEERFKGYSHADTPPDVRAAFEQAVVKLIPAVTLAERPAFARLVETKGGRLASAPAAQRRAELERLAKNEPAVARWPLMLADLDLSQGDSKGAIAAAGKALALEPGNKDALRVRGTAFAAEKRWRQALDDLAASGAVGTDRAATVADLRALVELGRFGDANDLFSRLPQELAGDSAIRQLAGTAAAGLARTRPTPTAPAPAAIPAPPATPTPTPVPAVTATPAATVAPAATTTPTAVPVATATPTAISAPVTPTAPSRNELLAPPAGEARGPAAAPERAAPAATAAAEQAELAAIQDLVSRDRFGEAMVRARRLADAHPHSPEAQYVAAELAYRTLRWGEAVTYFRRGGDPGNGRPLLLFYDAISLYETGDHGGAAALYRRALPRIKHTRYVDDYTRKILGPGAVGGVQP